MNFVNCLRKRAVEKVISLSNNFFFESKFMWLDYLLIF